MLYHSLAIYIFNTTLCTKSPSLMPNRYEHFYNTPSLNDYVTGWSIDQSNFRKQNSCYWNVSEVYEQRYWFLDCSTKTYYQLNYRNFSSVLIGFPLPSIIRIIRKKVDYTLKCVFESETKWIHLSCERIKYSINPIVTE